MSFQNTSEHFGLIHFVLLLCTSIIVGKKIELNLRNQSNSLTSTNICPFLLRSWQHLSLDPRPVVFVRIVGVQNTANEVCSLIVKLEVPLLHYFIHKYFFSFGGGGTGEGSLLH